MADGKEHRWSISQPALTLRIEVSIGRVGRKRCPRCRRLRVLFRQTAYSADQPVGYGQSSCLECAGLRRAR